VKDKKMTDSEISILFYLLDAVRTAPNKKDHLVKIATRDDMSMEYALYLSIILNSKNIIHDEQWIRSKIR
jgi:hypothetical protein